MYDDLNKLFNPASIAIVGASENEGKVGNVIARNVLKLGYEGKVYLINPNHQEILGQKCYPSLESIEEEVDLAIIAIPAAIVNETIQKASGKTKNFVIISSGFSEIGEEGKKREDELAKLAEEYNLNILGPNCLGFIAPALKLNASFAGGLPKKGSIAFVTQSGALAVAMIDMAKKENLRFSKIISIGNKMQIDETELIEYFETDRKTKVVAFYLEGVKDGKKFIEAARIISKKKPVVVLKAGKTKKAQKAIISHTGVLAGSDEIMDVAFESVGIIRAENLEHFIGLLKIISSVSFPNNNEAVIVTNAGGPGVLATDAFKGKQMKLAEFSNDTKNKLESILPAESARENPIDLLGDAMEDRYEKVFGILEAEKAGSVICLLTPQDQTPVEKIAAKIIDFKNKAKKSVITVFIGGEKVVKAIKVLARKNIPNFSFPDQAVQTLNSYHQWKSNFVAAEPPKSKGLSDSNLAKAKQIVGEAISQGKKALRYAESKKILELYGLETIEFQNIENEDDVEKIVKFPVVAKIDSSGIIHKTEKKALILDIQDEKELRRVIQDLKVIFPGKSIIVEPMEKVQVEIILGIKRDETFGPVIVFGLGGIFTEILRVADFLIPPMSLETIKRHLIESKIGFLFQETRGQKPYNLEETAQIIVSLMKLARDLEEVKELDINPLLIYNDGRAAKSVDIKVII